MKNTDYVTETIISDTMTLVERCENGKTFKYLNGTLLANAKNRFLIPAEPLHHQYYLIIEDYAWWHDNHYDITDWMLANLPRGEDHLKGMMLSFDNEEQRTWFLLRWQ